jgi:hypothetical protein
MAAASAQSEYATMTHPTGGTKRSSWLTFRRRLLLVRVLLRGAASTAELLAAGQAELGDEGYPPAAASALKHDLDALKAEYGCQIGYQRERGVYARRSTCSSARWPKPMARTRRRLCSRVPALTGRWACSASKSAKG